VGMRRHHPLKGNRAWVREKNPKWPRTHCAACKAGLVVISAEGLMRTQADDPGTPRPATCLAFQATLASELAVSLNLDFTLLDRGSERRCP
jgi:hypothetical protein